MVYKIFDAIIESQIFYLYIYIYVFYFIIKRVFTDNFKFNDISNSKMKLVVEKVSFLYVGDKLFVFLFLTTIIFVFLRISSLGKSVDILIISGLNIDAFFKLFFIILFFNYYFKTIHIIFYPYALKIHYYFYTKNSYVKIREFVLNNYEILSEIFLKLLSKCFKLEDLTPMFFKKKFKAKHNNIKSIYKAIYIIFFYIRKYKIVRGLTIVSKWGFDYISNFLYYLPHSFLVIVLYYDICQGQLYYIYYMSFVYLITNIVKKIKRFYHVKDPYLDTIISSYFYEDKDAYLKFISLAETKKTITLFDIFIFPKTIRNLLNNREEILNYIANDFKVYYIIDEIRANNEKYLKNAVIRRHILFLIFLLIFYLIYFGITYNVIFFNLIRINLILFLSLLSILLYVIHKKILVLVKEEELFTEWAESTYHKKAFFSIIILGLFPVLYIILKNKLTFEPTEIIFEIKNFICIYENYTLNDKIIYIKKYLGYMRSSKIIDEKVYDILWLKLMLLDLENITLENISDSIKDIFEHLYDDKKDFVKKNFLVDLYTKILSYFGFK